MCNIERSLTPRRNATSGFWLVVVVPLLLLQTGHRTLSMELIASSLAFIIMYEKSLLKFSLFPIYSLFFHCLYFLDTFMAFYSVFTMIFIFFCARELLILFPFTFTYGEALLLSHLSATFIVTQPLFLFAFLLIFIIERYSLQFNLFNLIILINLTFPVVCFYFTQRFSLTIVIKKSLCFITFTNSILLLFWLFLFTSCLAIIYFISMKNTSQHIQNDDNTNAETEFNFSNGSLKSEELNNELEEFWDCNLIDYDASSFSNLQSHSKEFYRPPSWYRKLFHFAAGIVFSSGLFYSPHLLQVCSALLLLAFWGFEWARRFGPHRLCDYLDSLVGPFRDERDAGTLIFTPIALLLGLSLPLWWPQFTVMEETLNLAKICQPINIHPSCWSGILSIAAGDSFAALIGRAYGKRRWPGTHRTYLGSFASLVSQVIIWLIVAHYFNYSWQIGIFPIIIGVLVEAYIEQIDNLVVPLIVMIGFHSNSFISCLIEIHSIWK